MPLLSFELTATACPMTSGGRVFVPMNEWAINLLGLTLVAALEGEKQNCAWDRVVAACLRNEFNKMEVICAYL